MPDVAIITHVSYVDLRFFRGWFHNLRDQTAINIFGFEVIIGVDEKDTYDYVIEYLQQVNSQLSIAMSFSVVRFKTKTSKFVMLDQIITKYAASPLLTFWSLCDRKRYDSLQRRLNIFNAYADIDVVTAQVLEYNEATISHWSNSSHYGRRLFSKLNRRNVRFEDMFQTLPGENGSATIVGSTNIPHNSAMWRKDLHSKHGLFNPTDIAQHCWDYSFWIRAMFHGAKMYHINRPLELYLARADKLLVDNSHGMQSSAGEEWISPCDSNATWNLYKDQVIENLKKAKFVNKIEYCKNGILSNGSDVCCGKACGSCGGQGCKFLPGGKAKCCSGNIRKRSQMCYTPLDVGCKVPIDDPPRELDD